MSHERPRFPTERHRMNGDLSLYCFFAMKSVPLDPASPSFPSEGRRLSAWTPITHPSVRAVRFFEDPSSELSFTSGLELQYQTLEVQDQPKRPVEFTFSWHSGSAKTRSGDADIEVDGKDAVGEVQPGEYEFVMSILDALHIGDAERFPSYRDLRLFIDKLGLAL